MPEGFELAGEKIMVKKFLQWYWNQCLATKSQCIVSAIVLGGLIAGLLYAIVRTDASDMNIVLILDVLMTVGVFFAGTLVMIAVGKLLVLAR